MVCPRSILLSALLAAIAVGDSILETVKASTDTSTFASYLDKFPNLSTSLEADNITLLVPQDSAFTDVDPSDITEALLTYHVLSGTYATFPTDRPQYVSSVLQAANGSKADYNQMVVAQGNRASSVISFRSGDAHYSLSNGNITNCTNGVIYTLSSLLTLTQNFSQSYDDSFLSGPSPFTDFQVKTADGIKHSLDNLTDVTVFLPISYSFHEIGSLVNIWSKDFLEDTLSYHVANGLFYLDSPPSAPIKLTSLDGKELTVSMFGGDSYVNNAKIVAAPAFLFDGGVAYSIYGYAVTLQFS